MIKTSEPTATPKVDAAGGVGKPERKPRIITKNENENDRQVEEVTMNILEDQREVAFPKIRLPRLAHRAIHRVHPERLIISAAIIIAGKAESGGNPHDQEGRGKREPNRPGRWRLAEHGVGRRPRIIPANRRARCNSPRYRQTNNSSGRFAAPANAAQVE